MAALPYMLMPTKSPVWWRVRSPEGREYMVNLAGPSCDCADFAYRGEERPCKHIRMVKEVVGKGVKVA